MLYSGRSNGSYGLAVIALKLREVFRLDGVNQPPLSFDIAGYEQNTVAVSPAVLVLGFENIRLGSPLPAFLSSGVVKVPARNLSAPGRLPTPPTWRR